MNDEMADLERELISGFETFDKELAEKADGEPTVRLRLTSLEDLSPFGQMLLGCCPPTEDNCVSFIVLARACGLTPPAVYNILHKERITYRRAKQILGFQKDMPNPPGYTLQDFEPYM